MFFPYIDVLRALAVALVFFYHVIAVSGWDDFPHGVLDIFRIGWVGVDLFFVLSGFLISVSLGQGLKKSGGYRRDFFMKRAARIMPLYFLTSWCYVVLVDPALFNGYSKEFFRNIIFHAAFIHNLSISYSGALNGAAWSIGVEVQFYLLMGLVFYRLPADKPVRVGIAGVLLAMLWRFIGLQRYEGAEHVHFLMHWTQQLPGTLDAFGLGCMLALIAMNENHRLHRFTKRSWAHFGFFAVAAVILSVMAWKVFWPHAGYWHHPGMVIGFRVLLSMVFLLWIWAVIVLPFSRVLNALLFPLNYIGKISYGVYLWHMLVIASLLRGGLQASLATTMTILLVTVLASIFTWYFVELPAMRNMAGRLKRLG